MKKLLFPFLLFAASLTAQRPMPDLLETKGGPLSIQPVFHAALVLTWNHKTIYIDPYGGAKAYEGLAAPDLILITDVHPDHLNVETLNALQTDNALFVVPQAVAEQLPEKFKSKLVVLDNGKNNLIMDMIITAVPMYNLPETADSKHPKGRGNGYVLELGGKRVYISGDTEDIPEMRHLKNIDLAFVCMNLPYTMDVQQAASAVLEFKPKVVYPFHYRGKDGLSDVNLFQKLVNTAEPGMDVRLRNWYSVEETSK